MALQFNSVNEGVVLLGADLCISKMNKSAEIMLNSASATGVGKHITTRGECKHITEALGPANSHLMRPISEATGDKPYSSMLKTKITASVGSNDAS